jgi:plasmid stability protein
LTQFRDTFLAVLRFSVIGLDQWQPQDPKWRNNGGTVATLNIKNLPDGLYKKLQARAKRDRRSVAQEVTHLLSEALEASKPLSILELRGLGKEHWQGIDAAAHVQRERASWD